MPFVSRLPIDGARNLGNERAFFFRRRDSLALRSAPKQRSACSTLRRFQSLMRRTRQLRGDAFVRFDFNS